MIPERLPRYWLVHTVALAAFVAVAFVGLEPFSDRLRTDHFEAADGSVGRQAGFLLIAALTLVGINRIVAQVTAFQMFSVLFSVYALMSAAWSLDPNLTIRRAGLLTLVVFTSAALVAHLGTVRSLRTVALTLGGLIILSFMGWLFTPNVWHLPSDPEPAVVGSFRGIFYHKNHAGFAAACLFIFSVAFYFTERRRAWLLSAFMAAVMLAMTTSRTPIVLLFVALIGMYIAIRAAKSRFVRASAILVLVFASGAAFAFLIFGNVLAIDEILTPEAFTGRGEIWISLSRAIEASPVYGHGYGVLFGAGDTSFFLLFADDGLSWAAHGHNGYLELWASLGFVGLSFAVVLFLIYPMQSALAARNQEPIIRALCFSLLLFVAFHNLLETSLADRARMQWVVLLIVANAVSVSGRRRVAAANTALSRG